MKKETSRNRSKVLITGGSGLIGRNLTSVLLEAGFSVSHLSRHNNHFGKVRVFRWDPDKLVLDPEILSDVDFIINLAGTNIGEKRWTRRRKKEILNSRIKSTGLLYKTVSENSYKPKAFISASAVGYYGSITSDRIFTEVDPPANDFLGNTCRLWEEEADQFKKSGIRSVKIRTAVVLDKSDSALSRLLKFATLGVFPVLGRGYQYLPWIHLSDLCNIYLKAILDEKMEGSYNAVAPEHITQGQFMRRMAEVMNRQFIHPPVPAIMLKLYLGEMANVVLEGSRISSDKIQNAGFRFLFSDVRDALENILNYS